MKTVYIAHPLRNDVSGNMKRVNEICQQLFKKGEIVPISPLHAFDFIDPHGPQELVFEYCRTLLSRCDEVWLHGNWQQSEGCQMEYELAQQLGIPVKFVGVEGDI